MSNTPIQAGMKKIGTLVGFHGLRGDVKIRPSDSDPAWVGALKSITLKLKGSDGKIKNEKVLKITQAKIQDRIVLCRFEGHPDKTSVEQYKDAEIWANEDDLPELEEDEFYADDLVNLQVLDDKSRALIGKVNEIVTAGAQDYLEIIHQLTNDKVLVPLNEHFVPEINPEEGFLTLANLDGFFEDLTENSND